MFFELTREDQRRRLDAQDQCIPDPVGVGSGRQMILANPSNSNFEERRPDDLVDNDHRDNQRGK